MAPSTEHNQRVNENVNPQQRPYQALTRKGGRGARPSAVVAAKLAVTTHSANTHHNGKPRNPTGIERSYESISRVLPSPRVLSPTASTSHHSAISSTANSYSSFTRHARARGSVGASAHRTSTGTVRAAARGTPHGSSGDQRTSTGTVRSHDNSTRATNQAVAASNRRTGSSTNDSSAKSNGGKATGIERSYDSVTQTIRSMATFTSPSSSSSHNNKSSSSRNGRSGTTSGPLGSGSSIERNSNGSDSGGSGTDPDEGMLGPPVPVASASFTSSKSIDRGSSSMASTTSTAVPAAVVHSSVPPPVGPNTTFTFDNASTQASRMSHTVEASTSMSMNEFEKLKIESRQLKAKHQARYGNNGGVQVATSREWTMESSVASTNASTVRGVSNAKASSSDKGGERKQGGGKKGGKELTRMSTKVISNKSGRTSSSSNHGRTKKGVVKMTTNGLSKIRGMLTMNSHDSSDEMSFYCSDGTSGKVGKQRVSLDCCLESSGDVKEMLKLAGYSGAGRRALPQSEITSLKSVKKAAESARESVDTATTNMKHGFEAATKTAVKVANEGVDTRAIKEMAPKIGTGIATTAKNTAKGVVKVTQQSVEGVGMMAKDLANAKTPARSNVTRNKHGIYADYVDDPDYKVVLTPVNSANGNIFGNAGPGTAQISSSQPWTDPKTPACLAGAVTAGRCNLPGHHPGSLEFLPEGIPRVLVVPEDWEERAGFVVIPSAHATAGSGGTNAIGITGEVGVSTGVFGGPSDGVSRGVGHLLNKGSDRRVSNPIDIDEETDTVNGEEIDREEMLALKEGRPSPKNNGGELSTNKFLYSAEDGEENVEHNSHGDNEDDVEEYNDPRNASMWVAVPEDTEEDDEDLLEKSMHVGDINIAELLDDDDEAESLVTDLVEFAKEYELITPTSSVGTGTFFVGDVRIGFESSPDDTKNREDANQLLLAEDAKRWTPDSKGTDTSENESCREGGKAEATVVLEAPVVRRSIEDLDIVCEEDRPQDPAINKDEDSLLSLAKSITAAVIDDKKKEFETPFSVKKGERSLSFSEFKTMNKQVLFDLENNDKNEETCAKALYSMESVDAPLCLNPSESTEFSREPPMRMVTGTDQQELCINPSEPTDLSQLSNRGPNSKQEPLKESARRSNDTGVSAKEAKSGKRQLKGRVILVRIKKKISKVAKKMLFFPFKGSKSGDRNSDELSIMNGSASYIVSLPKSNKPVPASPSSMSGSSIASSIMTGNLSATNRIIGAVPAKSEGPTPHQLLYGAINYGMRSMEDSTVSDALPPPPASPLLPRSMASCDEEDAMSYLAEAMKQSQGEDDDEESILLLVTPKVDGAHFEVISGADGTPLQMRDIIDAGSKSDGHTNGDVTNSVVKPNNLACLFTDEKGNTVHDGTTPIQIMDAVEVDGGIVLTPQNTNQNVSHVFRQSTDSWGRENLLPGSALDSDDDEDDTLLYHDGCTVIHKTSTFGDNTIATMTSIKEGGAVEHHKKEHVVNTSAAVADIGTPMLSPDGLPLSRMAATNGSFLFSPDNMGRAKPSIRAKERAKDVKAKPSITMLPAANKQTKKSECSTLMVRRTYSHEPPYSTPADVKSSPADDSNFNSSPGALVLAETVQEELGEFEASNQNCRSSYSALTNGGENVTSSPEFSVAPQEEDQTPLVSNTAPVKKKYPVTPFPDAAITAKTADEVHSSPLLVTLNSPLSSSPSISSFRSAKNISPSNVSISSFKSAKGNRKRPTKSVPKSAGKARKGFVKERVSHIQHRMEEVSSNGAVNGRLKRNHSYRYKNSRRVTNGNGVLAPKKAVLQTTYIRSVPIGIPKTLSVGNTFDQEDGYSIGGNSQEERYSSNKVDNHEEDISYAFKYTGPTTNATKLGGSFDKNSVDSVNEGSGSFPDASSYVSETTDVHEEDGSYALKYATKPVDSFDKKSVDSVNRGSGSFSDASSYVSETTNSDPFNSLLGKMASEDEESSSSDEEDYTGAGADDGFGKENVTDADKYLASPSAHLPFKSSTLVKPTELHQHNHQYRHEQPQQPQQYPRPTVSPMSAYAPTSKPNKWRTMAAAAARGGGDSTDSNIITTSARFRSEKSVKNLFDNE